MFRQTITRQARLFSTSVRARKSAVDSAKETLQSVDKTISQQVVKGIEGTERVAQSAKEAAGLHSGEAQGKANELAGEAKGKASELQGKASEMMNMNSGEAQGKANELAGDAKGKANELMGAAKGKANEVSGEAKSKMS